MACPCKLALRDLRDFDRFGETFITKFDFIVATLSPFLRKGSIHCNCIFKNRTRDCLKARKIPPISAYDFCSGTIRPPCILYEMRLCA